MKVLFAIRDDSDIVDSLVRKYKKDNNKSMLYKVAKNFTAITKEVQENNDYDRIVISDDFDEKINKEANKEAILLKKLKGLLSVAKRKNGKSIPVIFICKNNKIANSLMELKIYNFILKKDAGKKNIYELINNPRNVGKAKEYYQSITGNNNKSKTTVKRVEENKKVSEEHQMDEKLKKCVKYLNREGMAETNYVSKFEAACEFYGKKEILNLIDNLSQSTKKILASNSAKYKKYVPKDEIINKEKEKVNKEKVNKEKENKKDETEPKRGRGRPRKNTAEVSTTVAVAATTATVGTVKRGRGRPRKVVENVEKAIENVPKVKEPVKEIQEEIKSKVKKEEPIKEVKKEVKDKLDAGVKNVTKKEKKSKKNNEDWDLEEEENDIQPVIEDEIDLNIDDSNDIDNVSDEDDFDNNVTEEISSDDDFDFEEEDETEEDSSDDDFDFEEEDETEEDSSDDDFDFEEEDETEEDSSDDDFDFEEEDETEEDSSDDDFDFEEEDETEEDSSDDEFDLDDEELESLDNIDDDELDNLIAGEDEESDDDSDLNLNLIEDDDTDEVSDDDEFTFDDEDEDDGILTSSSNRKDSSKGLEDLDDDNFVNLDNDDSEDDEYDDILNLDEDSDDDDGLIDLDDDSDDDSDEINLDEDSKQDDDLINLDDDSSYEDDNDSDDEFLFDVDDSDDDIKIDDNSMSNISGEAFSGIANKNYKPNYDISKQLDEINNDDNVSTSKTENSNDKMVPIASMDMINIGDNQKIVAFVGAHNSGNSFLVNNLAQMLSEQGIKTAIVDLTKNKNSYYIYTENEETLRNIAYSSFEKLKSGIADGIKVNKCLTVYTSLPNSDNNMEDKVNSITTLLNNYSLVLLDCDFDTELEFFNIAQDIYFVQSYDILTIQALTSFIKKLKMNKVDYENKMKIVINKHINLGSINERSIVAAMSVYNSPDTTYQLDLFDRNSVEYFLVPFEEKNYCKYLEEVVKCKLTIRGYSKSLLSSLSKLAKSVYPINGKKMKNK